MNTEAQYVTGGFPTHHCLADFVYRNLLCTHPAPG